MPFQSIFRLLFVPSLSWQMIIVAFHQNRTRRQNRGNEVFNCKYVPRIKPGEETLFFWSFPYVCPEPVWVKSSF
jgi:hypothetical protein